MAKSKGNHKIKKTYSKQKNVRKEAANKSKRKGKFPECEKTVYDWILSEQERGSNATWESIREKMLEEVAKIEPQTISTREFTASKGWCRNFKIRHVKII